jgi:hypothetical protein
VLHHSPRHVSQQPDYWLQRLEDASAAVKKKNSDNVVQHARQQNMMTYKRIGREWMGMRPRKESQELVVL